MELSTSYFDTKQPKPPGSPCHCWQPPLSSQSKPGALWAESWEHYTCGAFTSVLTILSFKNKAAEPKELHHLEIRFSSKFCIFYFGISNTQGGELEQVPQVTHCWALLLSTKISARDTCLFPVNIWDPYMFKTRGGEKWTTQMVCHTLSDCLFVT